MDDDEPQQPVEKYQLRFWMTSGDPGRLYQEEHFFIERPQREIILMLFEEAKATYSALYPGVEPNDVSVLVTRLRPADDYRPDLKTLYG
jgi:hypothetical protein